MPLGGFCNEDLTWNCNSSCLQALALSPRTEAFDGKDGRSPMISPKASPLLLRKGAAPGTNAPPPLPLRRASPVLGSPPNLPGSKSVTVLVEESPPSTYSCADSSQKIDSDSSLSGVSDAAYDILQTFGVNLVSSSSSVTSDVSVPNFSTNTSVQSLDSFDMNTTKQEDSLQYSELSHFSGQPNYENIMLAAENCTSGKKSVPTNDVEADTKDSGGHLSASPLKTASTTCLSPLPPSSVVSSPFPGLSSSSSSLCIASSGHLLSPNVHPHTHPLPSPSRQPSTGGKINFRKSSLDEKHGINLNASENVSYENLNMDYIAQLTSEGYTHDAVIRALGITKNDVKMAFDILHEFATKKTTGTT